MAKFKDRGYEVADHENDMSKFAIMRGVSHEWMDKTAKAIRYRLWATYEY